MSTKSGDYMKNSRYMIMKKRRKRRRFAFSFFLILIIGASFGLNFIYNTIKASNNIFEELDSNKISGYQSTRVKISEEPFTVLLVGLEGQNGGERSDVLMLVTVNPKTEKVYVLSIPRDTKTYIPSLGYETKIAHSYGKAGIESTVESVSRLLDIPINYYITANFKGFEDIVDTIGGITVDVPFTFKAQLTGSLKWKTFYKGEMHLNGNETLAYVRMRKSDPKGDMGRNERQQQVIKEILDKGTSLSIIPKLNSIMEDLGDNVRTNFTFSDFVKLIDLYKKLKNVPFETLTLDGSGEWDDDVWYYIADQRSLSEISNTLNDALKLKQPTVVSGQ